MEDEVHRTVDTREYGSISGRDSGAGIDDRRAADGCLCRVYQYACTVRLVLPYGRHPWLAGKRCLCSCAGAPPAQAGNDAPAGCRPHIFLLLCQYVGDK